VKNQISEPQNAPATTSAGTTQYRWWTQEIGLIRQAVSPVTVVPARSSPRRNSSVARVSPMTRTTTARPSHTPRLGAPGAASRASSPSSDWSLGSVGGPTRPVCHSTRVQ
jgi:hypothetical protein